MIRSGTETLLSPCPQLLAAGLLNLQRVGLLTEVSGGLGGEPGEWVVGPPRALQAAWCEPPLPSFLGHPLPSYPSSCSGPPGGLGPSRCTVPAPVLSHQMDPTHSHPSLAVPALPA